MGYKARTLLTKTAGVNMALGIFLLFMRIVPGLPDAAASVIVGFLVLGATGTIIASIRHHGGDQHDMRDALDRLIDAFVASRPDACAPQPLRLVDPQETGSTIPAQRRSAP